MEEEEAPPPPPVVTPSSEDVGAVSSPPQTATRPQIEDIIDTSLLENETEDIIDVKPIALKFHETQSPEEKVAELQAVIEELNRDFGEKRAKFTKLFMQKEEELESERGARRLMETQLKSIQDELNESKSQVTVAELSKENEVYLERERSQELRSKYEGELQRVKHHNLRLETELNEVKAYISSCGNTGVSEVSPAAVFSAVTKSLARKLNSTLSTSNDSIPDMINDDKEATTTSKGKPPSLPPSKYADENAEMLRSLVVQLEEELLILKNKVRSSEEQLTALQNAQASLVKGNDALSILLQGETGSSDVEGLLSQLDEKLRETRVGLEAEKSSRADLEMYAALVNTQKTLISDDLDKAKAALKELRINYEEERKSHEDLKETWKKANEQFVLTQEAYEHTIRSLKSMMSPKQLETIKTEFNSFTEPIEERKSVGTSEEKSGGLFKCEECERYQGNIEKLRSDLSKAAKNRDEMEEDWNRATQEYQNKIMSVEDQLKTYEVLLMELHASFQQSIHETERQIKRLTFERDNIQKKIEGIELENESLRGRHVAHSEELQNENISLPNNIMELQELVLRLKEDLINVKVGKEECESELKFSRDRAVMEEMEKKGLEESLNSEISLLRDRLGELKARKHKYIDDLKRYERTVSDLRRKLEVYEPNSNKNERERSIPQPD